jgi:hypothetical protein
MAVATIDFNIKNLDFLDTYEPWIMIGSKTNFLFFALICIAFLTIGYTVVSKVYEFKYNYFS